MQLVAARGTEKGLFDGLSWIPGEVRLLLPNSPDIKLPHVGWNDIIIEGDSPLEKQKKHLALHPHGSELKLVVRKQDFRLIEVIAK